MKSGIAKITDFGLSGQIGSSSLGEGTAAYRDPLSFKDEPYKHRKNKKSDIFSLGVLLWEISSGKIPCKDCASVTENRKKGYRDPPFPGTPETYVQLYSVCWSENPEERPSCKEIYKQLRLLFNNNNNNNYLQGRTLDLSWKLRDAITLIDVLESNPSVNSLILSYNQIGDAGATALAKALESNSSLISLDLGSNQIGDAGATALAKALESNSSLTSLNLWSNQIGHAGATALAKALESNFSLTSLNLSLNQIGDAGATALAKALESNSSLTSLKLDYNI